MVEIPPPEYNRPNDLGDLPGENKRHTKKDNIRKAKAMSGKQIMSYAKTLHIYVVAGGRHPHLLAPDGSEHPIPSHGSRHDFGDGTKNELIKWVEKHGVRK